ncbi:MAG: HAMP domain-containing histidine kinase [Anaerolineae bacterium]|nr:HAMP domain-containing histidine kinase [Anaerolineae bacterium]
MSDQNDHLHSIRQIRRRLFWLLTLAFGVVVTITVVLLLVLLTLFISNAPLSSGPFAPTTLLGSLQAYYIAYGSWEGVEALSLETNAGIQASFADEWEDVLLLDETNRVLIDRGYIGTERVGQIYIPGNKEKLYPVQFNGDQVGTLAYVKELPLKPIFVFLGLLPGAVLVTCFAGVLTLIIGLLLMRRVVTPLADVIATAQEVASGNLSARVQVGGPSDLRSLSDSFNQMADSLERNDRERRNMLADIAHELRTPLTIMRGRLEGILDGVYPLKEDQIAPALEEVYVLDNLVEDLRLLTLAETRQLSLDCREINLGEIAENTASLFEAEAADKGISLITEFDSDLPTINADPQRIGQVIGNLLSNALRYIPAEGGQIKLAVQQVENSVTLSVSDNGPGIPEADLPHLFDRFWRSEKSRTRSEGGAGLGLAIAKQLVEMHGGTIGVESTPGKGARFWFRLPHYRHPEPVS